MYINAQIGRDDAMGKNIGFVSTRFAGTDGVSLEASKWAEVLRKSGHECYWFAGELDKSPDKSYLVPEAHFKNPLNEYINKVSFGSCRKLSDHDARMITDYQALLKDELLWFIDKYNIDMIIAQNCLTIPMQMPLGLALTEVIGEKRIDTIAHHHDFYWERERFLENSVGPYLHMAFPPDLPNIRHVVINSDAKEQLLERRGIESIVVPNVLDFDNPPVIDLGKAYRFRQEMGLKDHEKMVLQPTRVVERKGIEYAIELLRGLKDQDMVLVISHEAGDEGLEYSDRIKSTAKRKGVKLLFYEGKIANPIYRDGDYLDKEITLWDTYPSANLVTFPSTYEGFGNAFLEAILFRKPLMVNRYSVYKRDIAPNGFDVVEIDGHLTDDTVKKVRETTLSESRQREAAEKNYDIARTKFSYKVLEDAFEQLMN